MNNNIPKHQEHYEKYSDEDVLKLWQRDSIIKEIPPDVVWVERVKYGTDFN